MATKPYPVFLTPATPSELLTYIISHHKGPTTLVVGCTKQAFITALTYDVRHHLLQQTNPGDDNTEEHRDGSSLPSHTLLKATLLQIAVSRHIRILFTPSVTHLRASLSVFSPLDSKVTAPPDYTPDEDSPPWLVLYGLLELHRDASEWSAQGISNSAAILVDAGVCSGFRPVMVEPAGSGGFETSEDMLGEMIPLLNGATKKGDGSWSGRTVTIQRVLSRWFTFEEREWDPS